MLQDRAFLALVILVTIAFGWILMPFYGPVFWAIVLAIVFTPLYRYAVGPVRKNRTPAALITTILIVLLVILPAGILAGMLVEEGAAVYQKVQTGELNIARYLQDALALLPGSLVGLLERAGLTDFESIQARVSDGMMKSAQAIATHAFSVGQNTLEFVIGFFIMLYLMFFFLRDGDRIVNRVRDALPLQQRLQSDLASRFATVVRATIKGNLVVAIVQGALGGLIFWILDIHAPVFWGVVMAFLSLLPAVGTALVWLPVALYFLFTGSILHGVILSVYGVVVIGLVDNVLRPLLVGKDTRMPDYIVLITTLGGMAIFGINGFVIGPLIAAMFIAVWDTITQMNRSARLAAREPVAAVGSATPATAMPAVQSSPPAQTDPRPQSDVPERQ